VFGALIVLLLLISGATWESLSSARLAREVSLHSYEVRGTINDPSQAILEAETGQRGYLLTGSNDYLAPYQASAASASYGARYTAVSE
jgi:CHASE3 domain sensor protein